MAKKPKKPFTVLLLYPDYISETFGQETYLTHVEATTVKKAILAARKEAVAANRTTCPKDWFVLAVFEGTHNDINPG